VIKSMTSGASRQKKRGRTLLRPHLRTSA
jgi:hypothetical protein